MNTRFSIITAAYNSVKTVEQTIKSVLMQSYHNFEYIIVDGASKDGTVDIIKQYAGIDSRIKYISEPDHGIYDAMNKGIKMAAGDVIGLLNSDDFYETEALNYIAKHIPATDKYVVYGFVRFIKDEKEESVHLYSHNHLPEGMMMHPACFVSKAIYEKYQYDTSYKSAADYDLFLQLFYDKDIKFIPVYNIITNFRLGGMSSTAISYLETNDIKYKFGLINKWQHDIGNLGIWIKRKLI